jgi:hypothetical protein
MELKARYLIYYWVEVLCSEFKIPSCKYKRVPLNFYQLNSLLQDKEQELTLFHAEEYLSVESNQLLVFDR